MTTTTSKDSSVPPTSANMDQIVDKSAVAFKTNGGDSILTGGGSSSDPDSVTQNGLTNGNGNKRISKQKWVPLEIDLSKSRNKRDRTPRTKRLDTTDSTSVRSVNATDNDDDYYSDKPPRPRRFRPTTTNRGGRSLAITRGGRRPIQKNSSAAQRNRNASEYSDYTSEYALVNKLGTDAPPFMMPYMGTFYYNGVPSYVNMDSVSLKDAIKKQM